MKGQMSLTTALAAAVAIAAVGAGVYVYSSQSSVPGGDQPGDNLTDASGTGSGTGSADTMGSAEGTVGQPDLCDGTWTESDADTLQGILDSLQSAGLPSGDYECADVNGDGFVTSDDGACLAGLLSGAYASTRECPACDPGPLEICHDGVDNDCDGQTDKDTYDNTAGAAYSGDMCSCNKDTPCNLAYDIDGIAGGEDSDRKWCRDLGEGYRWYTEAEGGSCEASGAELVNSGFVKVAGGNFYLNGKKFYPYGASYLPSFASDSPTSGIPFLDPYYYKASNMPALETELSAMQNAGMTAISVLIANYDCTNLNDFLERAGSHGLKVSIWLPCSPFVAYDPESEKFDKCLDNTIVKCGLKDNDAIMSYLLAGEPRMGDWTMSDNAPYRDSSDLKQDFGRWMEKNYGSVLDAQTQLGFVLSNTCGLPNDAQCISHNIPSVMVAGQKYTVSMTMQNVGTNVWTPAGAYALLAIGDSTFASDQYEMGSADSISPAQSKLFAFTMTAPAGPGRYVSDWGMAQGGAAFGQHCKQTVEVIPAGIGSGVQETATLAPPVCGASDTQLCNDGVWRTFVAAYRRFYDDMVSHSYNVAARKIRALDPNHLLTIDNGLAGLGGDGSMGNCAVFPFDIRSTAKHLDFLGPEFYMFHMSDSDMYNADYFRKRGFITQYADVGKPVVYYEFGTSTACPGCSQAQADAKEQVQSAFYANFYNMAIESGADGAFAWWFTGAQPPYDYSIYGKPALDTVKAYSHSFKNRAARVPNIWFTIDRDAHSPDWLMYELGNNQYMYWLNQGMTPAAITVCTGKDSKTAPLTCVGNYEASNCPRKCLNSEFNHLRIRDYTGEWVDVKDGDTVVVEANKPIYAEVSMGNIGEAKWLTKASAGGLTGSVYLGNPGSGPAYVVLLASDVAWLKDADFGEFKVSGGIAQDESATFQLASSYRSFFGDKATIKLHPVELQNS